MKRTNKGGSVIGFILVALSLALLLTGGLYAVRQQFLQRQQPTPVAAPVATPQASPSQRPAAVKPNQQAIGAPQKAESTVDSSSSSVSVLPHTGPVETLGTLAGMGFLSWSLVAYVRSRRALPPILT